MARIFVYDNRTFPDPDPERSVAEVQAMLAEHFGELANAEVKETARGEDTVYEFKRRVGTKGASANAQIIEALRATPPVRLRLLEILSDGAGPNGKLFPETPELSDDLAAAEMEVKTYMSATARLIRDLEWLQRSRRQA